MGKYRVVERIWRNCRWCKKPMKGRADKRYCCGTCRALASRGRRAPVPPVVGPTVPNVDCPSPSEGGTASPPAGCGLTDERRETLMFPGLRNPGGELRDLSDEADNLTCAGE